ncbi:hypothetical protein [Pedobacter mucosus]|uniref:hypothetical protein n=1 Tax=Pedobacter mucosus TaxID=2895286 RepID=UPI001EE42907|nr:hypothetical protein [Pedobacter mucosus]UKT65602.1 hypothetical protein LOK61_07375 [Pedobacter mucosus]
MVLLIVFAAFGNTANYLNNYGIIKNSFVELEETLYLPLNEFEVSDVNGFLGELSDHYYKAHHYTNNIISAFNLANNTFGGGAFSEQLKNDKDGLILLRSLMRRKRRMIGVVSDKTGKLEKS